MSPACLQSIRLPLAMSVGILLDFHWFWSFGCGFAVSPLEVHQKSLLDFVVQPKMPGQAPENHRKNTVVKKQKNMDSAYPQSDGVHSEKQWECKDLHNHDPPPEVIKLSSLHWSIVFELYMSLIRQAPFSHRSHYLPSDSATVVVSSSSAMSPASSPPSLLPPSPDSAAL